MRAACSKEIDRLGAMFRALDTDCDGWLSAEDLRCGLGAVGAAMDGSSVADLARGLDVAGCGSVNLEVPAAALLVPLASGSSCNARRSQPHDARLVTPGWMGGRHAPACCRLVCHGGVQPACGSGFANAAQSWAMRWRGLGAG